MLSAPLREVARLTVVFLLLGLLTSRAGLLLHEFAGHGGAALLFGAEITDWRLFLFGGGWIGYESAHPLSSLASGAIYLAGIAFEFVAAGCLWIASRYASPRALHRSAYHCVALLLCAHGCLYLATGTHYGFGDGWFLHHWLSKPARSALVGCLCAGFVLACFALARTAILIAARTSTADGWRRIATTSAAIIVAAALHGGLYLGERAVVDRDPTYAASMQPEHEVRAERELGAEIARQASQGRALTVQEQERLHEQLIEAERPFPLTPVLILFAGMAALGGALRARARPAANHWAWRDLLFYAFALALALVLVLALHKPGI